MRSILMRMLILVSALHCGACKKDKDKKESAEEDTNFCPDCALDSLAYTVTLPAGFDGAGLTAVGPFSAEGVALETAGMLFDTVAGDGVNPVVVRRGEEPVLIGLRPPGAASGEISTTTTALALVLFNPVFIGVSGEQKTALLTTAESQPSFAPLVARYEEVLAADPAAPLNAATHADLYSLAAAVAKETVEAAGPALRGPAFALFGGNPGVALKDPPGPEAENITLTNPRYIDYYISASQTVTGEVLPDIYLKGIANVIAINIGIWPPRFDIAVDQATTQDDFLPAGEWRLEFARGFDPAAGIPAVPPQTLNDRASLYNTVDYFFKSVGLFFQFPAVDVRKAAKNLQRLNGLANIVKLIQGGQPIPVLQAFIGLFNDPDNEDALLLMLRKMFPKFFTVSVAKDFLKVMSGLGTALKGFELANNVLPPFVELIQSPPTVIQNIAVEGELTGKFAQPCTDIASCPSFGIYEGTLTITAAPNDASFVGKSGIIGGNFNFVPTTSENRLFQVEFIPLGIVFPECTTTERVYVANGHSKDILASNRTQTMVLEPHADTTGSSFQFTTVGTWSADLASYTGSGEISGVAETSPCAGMTATLSLSRQVEPFFTNLLYDTFQADLVGNQPDLTDQVRLNVGSLNLAGCRINGEVMVSERNVIFYDINEALTDCPGYGGEEFFVVVAIASPTTITVLGVSPPLKDQRFSLGRFNLEANRNFPAVR